MAVMNNPLVQKLTGVRDLKRILETTVKELGDQFNADACQVTLANPLDPNVTSICEYRAMGVPVVAGRSHTLPLVLQGRTFGAMTISRSYDVTNDELNYLRIILGELGEIIRLAQINDVVQRDTFRDTFLVEIGNLMTYSLGIGDALFMVVNILGKALAVSRCLFICTDDQQAGWKCYEYWQQDKVESLKQCYWPSADSALVAQTLLAREPLRLFEGQQNSYNSPAQEEMLLIGVKSLLGVALRSQHGVHGCVVLQQCDYRRAWTRNEIDMVQNVSDKVAEALYRLPVEKKAREPIMQLHQRIVSTPQAEESRSSLDVRRALKGALGQQAIPQALKSGQAPPPPPAPVVKPLPPTPPVPAPVAASAPTPVAPVTPVAAPGAPVVTSAPTPAAPATSAAVPSAPAPSAPPVAPVASAATPAPSPLPSVPSAVVTPGAESAAAPVSAEAKIKAQSITGEFPRGDVGPSVASVPKGITLGGDQAIAIEHDPYADLDFGDFSELGSLPDISLPTPPAPPVQESPWIGPDTTPVAPPAPEPTITAVRAAAVKEVAPAPGVEVLESFAPEPVVAPATPVAPTPTSTSSSAPATIPAPSPVSEALDLSALDAIPTPKASPTPSSSPAPAASVKPDALDLSALDAIPTPKAVPTVKPDALDLSALDAIPTPKAPPTEAGAWGNLDEIPAPGAAAAPAPTPRGGGLGGSLMGKARGSASSGPLKSRLGRSAPPPEPVAEAVSPSASSAEVGSKPDEPFDAEAAQKKLDALVSNQGDGTSDYIFATPGLDMRMLGRIDGWVSQIEAKDKYKGGHAKAVAEYAQAIAKEMGLPQADIDLIRQASLVHDLGKLGTAAPILQKADNELSDAEFLMIMNHTIDGAELLDSFPDLKPLAPIVRAHHEEYDGNGYPLGLKGEQIPLAARVIGLANYYHERVADKANGKAGDNPGKVQMEIVEAAGKQFDPNACQGLIQAIITGRVSEKL